MFSIELSMAQCYTMENEVIEFSSQNGNTSSDYTNTFVLTDVNDIILEFTNAFIFNGRTAGSYKIYAINHLVSDSPNTVIGNNINTIQQSCFTVSDPFNILICPFTTNECYSCNGQPLIFNSIGGSSGAPYLTSYLIVSMDNIILDFTSVPEFNGLPAGLYYVFSLTYDENIPITNLSIGNNMQDIQSDCMDVSLPFMFKVCASPALTELSNVTICSGESTRLALRSNGLASYEWSNGSTMSFIEVSPAFSTSYSVTVTSLEGCMASKSINVNVDNIPTFDLGPSVFTCSGEEVQLFAPILDAQYLWSTGSTSSSITVAPSSTSVYSLTITNENDCSASDNVTVVIQDSGEGGSFDYQLCQGEVFELFANISAESYLWNTGQSTPSIIISPNSSTQYSVLTENANGCSILNVFNIEVAQSPNIDLLPQYQLCQGESLSLAIDDSFSSYLWSTGENSPLIEVAPLNTSVISVTVTDDKGCQSVANSVIDVLPSLDLELGPDRIVCEGDLVNIQANVLAQSYLWSDGSTANNLSFIPQSSGLFSLTVTANNGCTSEDQIFVTLTTDCTLCTLYDCNITCSYDIGRVEFAAFNGNTSDDYATKFLLVNSNGTIIGLSETTIFNIPNEGIYFIYSINYTDQGTQNIVAHGMNIDDIDADCFDISEPYVIRVCLPVSITSVVWKDSNGNGLNDTNEMPVEGVVVSLFSCDGTLIDETLTDSNGIYEFFNVPNGQYYLSFNLSNLAESCVFTIPNVGDDSIDSDTNLSGITECFDIVDGIPVYNISAGVTLGANIGNEVWHDLNGNGIQDIGEPPIQGVTVNLFNGNSQFVASTTTNETGYYYFTDLNPGDYYLQFADINDYEFTFPNMGVNNANDSEVDHSNGYGTTAITTLSPGESDLDWDAGLFLCAEIGDLVWYDINENDLYDPTENGINGIVVNLWRKNNDTSFSLIETAYTSHKPDSPSQDGYYKFCAPPGTYYIEVVLPPYGLVPARPNRGSNEEYDSDITNQFGPGTSGAFTLISNMDKCDLGAGYYPMAQLGDRVWLDNNYNGIQDIGENGVQNVLVEVYNLEGDLIGSDITDHDGEYKIDYLQKEDYFISVDIPQGFSLTQAKVGEDDFVDSDIDHSFGFGTSQVYSLSPGQDITKVDIGLVSGVLPLEWQSFEVSAHTNYNLLSWETFNEVNVDHFVIERKLNDEVSFEEIAELTAMGDGENFELYKFKDFDQLLPGIYYYRIRSVDYDGSFSYSQIKLVLIEPSIKDDIQVFPNPSPGLFNIEVHGVDGHPVFITLYASDGRKIFEDTKKVNNDTNNVNFLVDITNETTGVYLCKISSKFGSVYKRLIKT